MSTPVIKTEEVILENVEYNSAEELDDELQLQLEDSGGESYQYQSDGQTIVQPQHIVMKTSRQRQISNLNQGGAKQTSGVNASSINNKSMDSEKRMRREIANSNERRRMQSINAGFQNLRSLLPRHEGEKLSKAAILQQTSAYICELENQKTQLLSQNSQLKRQLGHQEPGGGGSSGTCGSGGGDVPCNDTTNVKKRKLTDNVVSVQTISDSSDEGVGSMSPEPMTLLTGATASVVSINNSKAQMFLAQNAAKEILDLKEQLYKETRLRTALEEELQGIKRQLITVATAPQPTVVTEVMESGATTYIPREVIEHTDNLLRDDCGPFTYVEIDELTGQEHMVVCSSVEELDSDAAAAAEIITEDNVHEEVILSSTSSTESEQESAVSAIAKVYAEGNSPSSAILQPILQAAIKATPKVEVERITDATLKKVKTEKIEQTSGLTRSRQNLETIVEAIRHLEGDHLFTDGTGDQHKVLVAQAQQHVATVRGQETPLALTTKQNVTQRKTLAELRPFLQIKGGNKQVTIVGGGTTALTLSKTPCTAVIQTQKDKIVTKSGSTAASSVTPTAIFKVQTTSSTAAGFINSSASCSPGGNVTITTTALKQCRPGVIVAKQLS